MLCFFSHSTFSPLPSTTSDDSGRFWQSEYIAKEETDLISLFTHCRAMQCSSSGAFLHLRSFSLAPEYLLQYFIIKFIMILVLLSFMRLIYPVLRCFNSILSSPFGALRSLISASLTTRIIESSEENQQKNQEILFSLPCAKYSATLCRISIAHISDSFFCACEN